MGPRTSCMTANRGHPDPRAGDSSCFTGEKRSHLKARWLLMPPFRQERWGLAPSVQERFACASRTSEPVWLRFRPAGCRSGLLGFSLGFRDRFSVLVLPFTQRVQQGSTETQRQAELRLPPQPGEGHQEHSVPRISPSVITKLQEADQAPRDPATEGRAGLGVGLGQPTRPWGLITCLQKKPCCRTGEGRTEMGTGHLCRLSLPPGLRHEKIVGSLAVILPLLPEVQFSVDSCATSQTRPAS